VKSNLRFASLIFYLLSAIVIVAYIATFINAYFWINKTFPGFLIYRVPLVGSFKNNEWPGIQAGLKLMDRIMTADGKPVRDGWEVVHLAEKKPAGTPIEYQVESKGRFRQVTVNTTVFSLLDFFIVFLIMFIGGGAIFIIGLIVHLLKPNTHTSWVFFVSCAITGTYMFTGFEMQSSYLLLPLHYFTIPLAPTSLFHIGAVFPEKKKLLIRYPFLEYLLYLPAIILSLMFEYHLFTFAQIPPAGVSQAIDGFRMVTALTRLLTFICVAGLVVLVLHSLFKSSTNVARQRARVVLIGVLIGWFLPGTLMLVAHFLKVNFPWNLLILFIIFFPLAIAYSIIRHNLFDADALIKRTLGYAIMTIILIGTYALISLGLNFFLEQYQVAQSRAFPVLFTLLFILIFNPLRNRIQDLVDRIFFRKEYDAKQIIDRLGTAMTSLMDLPQILRQLVTTFSRDLFIDNSAVLLLDASGNTYQVRLSEGEKRHQMEGITFQKSEPLSQIIEKEKKEITKYDVLEDPKYEEICLDCAQNFSTLYASLIIPMVLRGEVIGFLSLGEKKSGKFYNREDIDLLRTLASQGAVAIENARMAEQMKNEEAVRANLARYLSPQIVDQIIQNNVQVNLGGDRKEVTVLFSDIRNFTSISESMKPEQLVEFLNEYFTEMARIIFANQGSLDKYIGDAVVAVFGSLIPLENSAGAAIKASIEMMRELVLLNEKWKDRYGFKMEMGIGINTGEVFLGNIGSPERMEFTVIGDTVNTASRFSSLAKGRQILATRSARERLGAEFQITQLPSTRVKGKAEEVEVFEVVY
jgi:adenylate cyclase